MAKRIFGAMLAIIMLVSVSPAGTLTADATDVPAHAGSFGDTVEKSSSRQRVATGAVAATQAGELLTPVPGSGCVVDYVDGYIYGLALGLTSLTGYVNTANGYGLSCIPTLNGFGTGTVVNVTMGESTFESYTIIIFGDVTGDSNVDGNDAGLVIDFENYTISWDTVDDAALFKAGDLNGDGNVDSNDAGIMVESENYLLEIGQGRGLPYSGKIYFDSAGGSSVAPLNGYTGDDVVAPAAPVRTGYTFKEWLPALPATFSEGEYFVVAQWTINHNSIIFDSAGGSEVPTINQDYGTEITAPANPTRTGYTFARWLPEVPSTMPAVGITCVAQWDIIYYSITFDANGGTGGQIPSVAYGVMPTPPNVKRLGYVLDSWSPEIVPAAGEAVYTAQWTPYTYITGDIIEYGLYPQTKVTNAGLITALNAETLSGDNTVIYGGEKYKRVYFTQYTALDGGTSTDPLDTKQDDNGYYINTVYWFKFEPVQWRVLSNSNDELLVLAETIVDSKAYFNQPNIDVTWKTCTVRNWLNDSFYNTAFSSAERTKIITSTVINPDNTEYGTLGGDNTEDKLLLLSQSETANPAYGFNPNYNNPDISREAQGSDFSKCSGLYVIDSSEYAGNSIWWLRSPGYYQNYASNVDTDGYGGRSDTVNSTYIGVRPAFRIHVYE